MSPLLERAATPIATARTVRDLDASAWTDFVDRHPDASIFHTAEMYRVFERTRRHRPAVLAVLDGTDRIRALMTSVEIATLGGPLRPLASRVVAFAGPIAQPGEEALIEPLLRGYQDRSPRASVFTEIRHHVDPVKLERHIEATGFRFESHLNFLVDLSVSEEELWQRVASSARRNVRKARKMGVTVEQAEDEASIREGYEVLRSVYERIRVPLPDRSLFDASMSILGPLGRFRMLLARVEGRPIGVLTLLSYKDVVTYWYVGTLREFAGHRPGDLLVWEAIAGARASGCRMLDFGGAGRPDQPYGVRDFKAKYGGQLVDLGRDVWSSAPFRSSIAKVGYGLARRFL